MTRLKLVRVATLGAATLCCVYAALLANLVWAKAWPVMSDGSLAGLDFVPLYAAGRLALDGSAAAAYDWAALWDVIDALGGQGTGGWLNPPTFLLALAPLAALPYVLALAAWLCLSGAFFAAAMRAILPVRNAVLLGFAPPASLLCIVIGQSSFIAAGLMAFTLAFFGRRPYLAGIFLGLLTYKPQFGLLFPVLLAADARWRVLVSAAATAAVLAVVSGVAFGWEAWGAFFGSIGSTASIYLGVSQAQRISPQSVYATIAALSGSRLFGVIAHALALLGVIFMLIRLWRNTRARTGAKAAGLVSGSLLATPYLFPHDAVILTIGAAFLANEGRQEGFLPGEILLLVVACLLPGLLFFVGFGFILPAASVIILSLAVRRGGAHAVGVGGLVASR